jgi:hypothetical protein
MTPMKKKNSTTGGTYNSIPRSSNTRKMEKMIHMGLKPLQHWRAGTNVRFAALSGYFGRV